MKKIILAILVIAICGSSCTRYFDPVKPANPRGKFKS
jgi:hypothetical protein